MEVAGFRGRREGSTSAQITVIVTMLIAQTTTVFVFALLVDSFIGCLVDLKVRSRPFVESIRREYIASFTSLLFSSRLPGQKTAVDSLSPQLV